MAGTIAVLALALTIRLAAALAALVATFHLAKRQGLRVKSVSWSLVRGYTAEFFPPQEEPQSGNN